MSAVTAYIGHKIAAYLWHIFALGSCLEFVASQLLLVYLRYILALDSCLKLVASELLLHIFVISLAYLENIFSIPLAFCNL